MILPDVPAGGNVIAHGVDIVDIPRVVELKQKHGQHLLDRLFTPAEQSYCLAGANWPQHLSGRFAAKEAVLKMLGTGWRGGIAWTDIEVTNDKLGAPMVLLSGECEKIAREKNISEVLLSISHTKQLAIASALGLGSK